MGKYGAGNDGCVWNPDEGRLVWNNEAHYHEAQATVMLGAGNNMHRLCEACSRLPHFSRLRKRKAIVPRTVRMSVEYSVRKVVEYMGQVDMDVPVSKIAADGSIDLDWVRMNYPHHELDVSDEDIMDEQIGGYEQATAVRLGQPTEKA